MIRWLLDGLFPAGLSLCFYLHTYVLSCLLGFFLCVSLTARTVSGLTFDVFLLTYILSCLFGFFEFLISYVKTSVQFTAAQYLPHLCFVGSSECVNCITTG